MFRTGSWWPDPCTRSRPGRRPAEGLWVVSYEAPWPSLGGVPKAWELTERRAEERRSEATRSKHDCVCVSACERADRGPRRTGTTMAQTGTGAGEGYLTNGRSRRGQRHTRRRDKPGTRRSDGREKGSILKKRWLSFPPTSHHPAGSIPSHTNGLVWLAGPVPRRCQVARFPALRTWGARARSPMFVPILLPCGALQRRVFSARAGMDEATLFASRALSGRSTRDR